MRARIPVLLRLCVVLLLIACGGAARADTPVSLLQAFRGQVNFTGTEETLRTKSNNQPCRLVGSGSGIYAYLGGIPKGATILSAQLYWAGSGKTPDYSVVFDGIATTAPSNRRYTSATIGGGYSYFSGAADVTSEVAARGNGYYTFSGLSVDNGDPWCSAQGVVGGFSLLVVYSSTSEPYRLLNVYEGFQYFRNSGFTLTLDNFAIPNPLPANTTGRVGHITWEGDGTLSGGGEDLLFNGYEMTDSINHSGNQFNSASNITGDTTSYGIDFDAYTVGYPVIKPGQTTATTTYRSGQDMVLLSAEVAALPYIPTSDLALSMTRNGTLQVGSTVDYVITVKNAGADTEAGPVTVVDTLPAGLALASTRGTGWTCGSTVNGSSQTIVTCTSSGAVAAGATMNTLTLTVKPSRGGSYTNTATVSGQTADANSGNNSASNSGSAAEPPPTSSALVFTTRACAAGEPIDASDCPPYSGPITLTAGDAAQIYITNVTGSAPTQVAAQMGAQDTKVSVQMSLVCAPNSGVKASYAGAQLDCANVPQAVPLDFQPNTPSAKLPSPATAYVAPFTYFDVGQMTLTLRYNGNPVSQQFISRPAGVVIYKVRRDSDKYPDLNDQSQPDIAFAKAGESFWVELAATMKYTANYAPGFGHESPAPPNISMKLSDGSDNPDLVLPSPNFTTPSTDPDSGVPVLVGSGRWYEAGKVTLSLGLDDYLGTGGYPAVQRTIGRFYPDHFTTGLTPNFDCLPAMNCPAASIDPNAPAFGVGGATYAGQPFAFTVKAYGLPRDDGKETLLNLTEPSVTLSVVSLPNATAAPSSGSFTQATPGPLSPGNMSGLASFQLPNPYQAGTPVSKAPATGWSAPVVFYLRAEGTDQRMVAGSSQPQAFTISSRIASTPQTPLLSTQIQPLPLPPVPASYEAGLMVVNGRLLVGNVFGSELARVPLPVTAQYWTGTAWQTNTNDDASVVGTGLSTSHCVRAFASQCGTDTPVSIKDASNKPLAGELVLQLDKGTGKLILQSPGRDKTGSFDISVLGEISKYGNAATWLPSTLGHASFGLFKSPLIYLREVY